MTQRAKESFWHPGGQEEGGTLRADDDDLVLAYPVFYEAVDEPAPARRGPGRPPGSKNKPKPDADE